MLRGLEVGSLVLDWGSFMIKPKWDNVRCSLASIYVLRIAHMAVAIYIL